MGVDRAQEVATVEKRYMTAPAVERTLLVFERKFALSTAEFYEAHYDDAPTVAHIPRRHRALWASMHRTHMRLMGGGALADRIERELEPA
jgi:hypothetical protein